MYVYMCVVYVNSVYMNANAHGCAMLMHEQWPVKDSECPALLFSTLFPGDRISHLEFTGFW